MFIAYDVAREVTRGLAGLLERIREKDADLADQAYRAAKSMALNVAEGGKREHKDRRNFFRIAAGSAQELKMALDVAEDFRILSSEQTTDLRRAIDRELGMLWRLSHPRTG